MARENTGSWAVLEQVFTGKLSVYAHPWRGISLGRLGNHLIALSAVELEPSLAILMVEIGRKAGP